jgi:hypothetical protein
MSVHTEDNIFVVGNIERTHNHFYMSVHTEDNIFVIGNTERTQCISSKEGLIKVLNTKILEIFLQNLYQC